MVLYLIEVELPPASAERFEGFAASHVAKAAAAMGRGSLARRARVVTDAAVRFVVAYELPDVKALESYLTSRDGLDLSGELQERFPEAKVTHRYAELEGTPRRGMRHGEEPGAAYVLRATLPETAAQGWATYYDEEHVPEVLRERCFVRERRFRLHDDDDSAASYVVIYDAVDVDSVEEFRREAGPRLAEDHEKRQPQARLERQIWRWL
jgi:hypothetical protein